MVHEPGFELWICDDPQFRLAEVEEGDLSKSDDDVGSDTHLTSVDEVALLRKMMLFLISYTQNQQVS